jgi:hypothetical protein
MTPKERAKAIVAYLFVNVIGEQAEHLVLTSKEGRDLGGWFPKPIEDRIEQAIAAAIKEEREACAAIVENPIKIPDEPGQLDQYAWPGHPVMKAVATAIRARTQP